MSEKEKHQLEIIEEIANKYYIDPNMSKYDFKLALLEAYTIGCANGIDVYIKALIDKKFWELG
jgi:hypothetical protein